MQNEENQNQISGNDIHVGDINNHIEKISNEFRNGFEFLKQYPRSVTIFGSSMVNKEEEIYHKAEELAGRIVNELGYAIITGGGPGIMEAANKGACESGGGDFQSEKKGGGICSIKGVSAGLTISLPHEISSNNFTEKSMRFSYFFSRKAMLTFTAEAFIFFPGGYGTMDELFSVLTLIQTAKIPKVPVMLYDSKFWNGMHSFMKETMSSKYHTINDNDLNLFEITDSFDRILEVVKGAPVSSWWDNLN